MEYSKGDLETIHKNGLTASEITLNGKLEYEIAQNPTKMPKAVWYIVPNEFGERFCFYGISPLLYGFFKDYMGLGTVAGIKLSHGFKFLAYFTPLAGAALSDLLLGKYHTIIYLSFLYIIGILITTIFSAPFALGIMPEHPYLWGPLIGLICMALGTGGIKPCVSSHGGDQFLDSQKTQLNKFYNYFYMAINAGSVVSGLLTPALVNLRCYGSVEKSCYPQAFGVCAVVMIFSVALFMLGKNAYRIVPSSKIFIPWIAIKVLFIAAKNYWKATPTERKNAPSVISFAEKSFSPEIMKEVFDLTSFFLVLLPAPLFWFAEEQSSVIWQTQYNQMNNSWFGGLFEMNAEQSSALNGIMIVILVPIFANFIYPEIERRGMKFKLIDRMIVGMGLMASATLCVGIFQMIIYTDTSMLVYKNSSGIVSETPAGMSLDLLVCDQNDASRCMSSMWHTLPYFLLTCGELLFSISGLNLAYQEVGKLTKASATSLWLLQVALGNLLDMALADLYPIMGSVNFMFMCTTLVVSIMPVYIWIGKTYVYRTDRPGYVEDDWENPTDYSKKVIEMEKVDPILTY